MKRIGESQLQRIIRKTGRKPIQCKCKLCQQQCHTPCLGTPQDILKLIKAGYADRLSWTDWAAGIIMGCTDHVVGMVQATAEGDWCTFFHDGLCELHDKGLKPTEGRLSHHSMRLARFPELGQSIRNGIMLCHRCHKEVHCNPWRNIELMKAKAEELGIDLKERYDYDDGAGE